MAMEKSRVTVSWGGDYVGEISALCYLPNNSIPASSSSLSPLPFLLAGTGSQILLFDLHLGRQIQSFYVFQGLRVHGIAAVLTTSQDNPSSSSATFTIVVSGERKVKLYTLRLSQSPAQPLVSANLVLLCLLPRFTHWVLDFCFLQDGLPSSQGGCRFLAVGCSDNSVHVCDTVKSTVLFEVRCPERCLLYSMKFWGRGIEGFLVASGTIFNEIVVWKLFDRRSTQDLTSTEEYPSMISTLDDTQLLHSDHIEAKIISRLSGHQGSIFCLSWSSDGSKLVSVSDDRSARMWIADTTKLNTANGLREVHGSYLAGPMLFGHGARVWDCCITDSLIVTAGEDCTCRVWGLDGGELRVIKEHTGRGIWRCLYDPYSSLLVTAGFDSAIKVHCLPTFSSTSSDDLIKEVDERKAEVLKVGIPNSSGHIGLMDSKSEYVRCLKFARKDTIYIATNLGYVYHAKLCESGSVEWTELVRVTEEVPVICMEVFSRNLTELALGVEDSVAVGDGRGAMKVIKVRFCDGTPKVAARVSWSAEMERQLLGIYWCKSLGCRFIFTSNPRGFVKLWRLYDPLSEGALRNCDAHLIAEFVSPFGVRIVSLDASCEEEVLVCGDLRGNLVLFPLLKSIVCDTSPRSNEKSPFLTYFKGAHGISAVCSISVASFSSTLVEICSTGRDGCICYLEYDKDRQTLEFVGMRQTKELTLVQSISADHYSLDDSANITYAVGFSSTDFLIWNLESESKVLQVKCGGWRRPYSYHLGRIPEMCSSFAYVKDEIIYIHRYWIPDGKKKIFPCNLHLQFHGKEIHSLCIIPAELQSASNEMHSPHPKSNWIATGCEDGTVRLTKYNHDAENWAVSNLLGEHVGGSAVRSLCFVSKIHSTEAKVVDGINGTCGTNNSLANTDNPGLLISVGAKRVLTSWLLRKRHMIEEDISAHDMKKEYGDLKSSSRDLSSMSFKWLSTDMPVKSICRQKKTQDSDNLGRPLDAVPCSKSVLKEMELIHHGDAQDNDWRYLAVTAFLVTVPQSRLTVCFVVVACSDATLMLRALVLPYRYWFDVVSLAPLASPVLALQHAVNPLARPCQGDMMTKNVYIVISGSTDGSIAFWDLTSSVEAFLQHIPSLHVGKSIDYQKRPRTGRGSQGGRWWKSLDASVTAKRTSVESKALSNETVSSDNSTVDSSLTSMIAEGSQIHSNGIGTTVSGCGDDFVDSSPSFPEIKPLHIMRNVHQSGVNCLHLFCQNLGNSSRYSIISGGDDQTLNFLQVVVVRSQTRSNVENIEKGNELSESSTVEHAVHRHSDHGCLIHVLHQKKALSAHSSAVKAVWTDGIWVFSTGLDQRVRCWNLQEHDILTEYSHFITSVPEPEALDVRACGSNCYQVVVAGRGMQVAEIVVACEKEGK